MTFKPSTTFLGAAAQSALDTTNVNVSTNASNILTNTTDISNISIKTRTESGELTVSAAGTHTWAHGLGELPKTVGLKLKCISADLDYSVGDLLPFPTQANTWGGVSYGAAVKYDATNVYIKFGLTTATLTLLRWSNGGAEVIDPTKWKLIIWAEA